MKILENKIPPPIIAAFFALMMWVLSKYTFHVAVADLVRAVITASILFIGACFCLAGGISFRRAKTTVNPLKPESASSLVRTEIYAISRNPMYVGFALFLVAWSAYLACPPTLIGVIGFVLYINRFQITPEERALAALFGAEFTDYKSQVRRWL